MQTNQTFNESLNKLSSIIGIAPNAWSRPVPAEFVKNYSIICHKNRSEMELVSRDMEVFCIEKELSNIKLKKSNAKEMLLVPEVQQYVSSKQEPVWLLVYKSTKGVEEIAAENGWNIIGNAYEMKKPLENKKSFKESLVIAGIEPIPGETLLVDQLYSISFSDLQDRYGEKVVFQVAEMVAGGGTGTAFVETVDEFERFKEKVTIKREKLISIAHINAARYIDGIPTSIPVCVTQHGILVGRIQTQVLDIPEVRDLSEGSGLFCGHDWSFRQYDEDIQIQAQEIGRKYGEYVRTLGYKGILGLDILVDEVEKKVWPVECNPRFTDAFPVVSEMLLSHSLVPMDIFHILEHTNTPYEFDIEALNHAYLSTPLEGAQIILETKTESWMKVVDAPKAGVYRYTREAGLEFVRDGYRYEHLAEENEFLITEGVPFPDTVYKPGARLFRLVFKKGILKEPRELTDDAKAAILSVYNALKLVETEPLLTEGEDEN